jgi:hypothetical protein
VHVLEEFDLRIPVQILVHYVKSLNH